MIAPIRLAMRADLAAINDIYNQYVETSTCTYQLTHESMSEREFWFDAHGVEHPITVVTDDARVTGWASLSPFKSRLGYRHTVENSIYIDRAFHRMGLGAALLVDQIARARAIGHHAIVAGIDAEQLPSIALHERHGFVQVGRLNEVGRKFDRWLDCLYLELRL